MPPERWQQVEELFQAALACAPAARANFLSQACPHDPDLKREVEKLLAAFAAADDFLETPAADRLGFAQAAAPALAAGQQLAHYEVISLLGKGGMGEVYLARDTKLDRQIALKLLPAHFAADAASVKRFEHEARAASALNHPNIITIHEIGQDHGTHFIATEYIAGETLRQRLQRGKLAPREAIAIARQLASALAAAHKAGLVHRDIKPENVMIWPDGLVKVLDFGLAKTSASSAGSSSASPSTNRVPSFQTDPEVMLGTLSYLSPEQVRREELDARTDLFSLGVVLYEMLTGERPFTGATAGETCAAILQHEPPAIPLPDAALRPVVRRALAKPRDQRWQSAVELHAALAQCEQHWSSAPRRATPRLSWAIAVALVLVAFGVWRWQTRSGSSSGPYSFTSLPAQKLTDLAGQELFPSLSPDGQSVVFARNENERWDIYRQHIGTRQAVNLTAGGAQYNLHPAYAPDGQHIAFYSTHNGGGIFLMDGNGGNLRQLTETGYNPAWSPDGRELALTDDRIWDFEARNTYPSASRLWAVNVTTRQQRVITEHDAVQPNWSPDGQRIAFWGEQKGGQRDIWTVAASGGEPVPVTDDEFIDWNPVWSPAGDALYFLSNRGGGMNLWRVEIDESSGRVLSAPVSAILPANNSQHVSFARNGRSLVYAHTIRSENIWQCAFDPVNGAVTGAATPLTQGLKRYSAFTLAPDEEHFAYLGFDEPQPDLFVTDRTGAIVRRLTDDLYQDTVPRWSPDGSQIAFLSNRSGKYEIWKIRPDGTGLAQMTDAPGQEVLDPVWSPDGKRLHYQIRNVNSFIIEADRPGHAQTPQPLPGQAPPGFLAWDWSPDGTQLAGWLPGLKKPESGIAVYSFAKQSYQHLTTFGSFPVWLKDSQRLLFSNGISELYLLDLNGSALRPILSIHPNQLNFYTLSQDNRRLYFGSVSLESDIWLMKLE